MDTHDYNVALEGDTEAEDDLEKGGGEELGGIEEEGLDEKESPERYDLGEEDGVEQ